MLEFICHVIIPKPLVHVPDSGTTKHCHWKHSFYSREAEVSGVASVDVAIR
jgi:hypothetical protein